MDLDKIIAELRVERDRIDEAILAIERIAQTSGKRRGRRPKWLLAAGAVSGALDKVSSNHGKKAEGGAKAGTLAS